jgi:hypothetical protein
MRGTGHWVNDCDLRCRSNNLLSVGAGADEPVVRGRYSPVSLARDVLQMVKLAREYMHHRSDYRFGSSCYWVRIYEGEPGDAPVVLCSPSTEIGSTDADTEASRCLAAEVVREFFADGL